MGATISSEQTAAAEGTVGELRRDPFAMLPFCGYNMADYFSHWLAMGDKLRRSGRMPRIFQVNWFRKDDDGSYLWPGFGENARVLEWVLERVSGETAAVDGPLGLVPAALNVSDLSVSLEKLFAVDTASWLTEASATEEYFATFGDRMPARLYNQLAELRARLSARDSSAPSPLV
jgi:phosphoenolpyruvate carboxykinase (GTP)